MLLLCKIAKKGECNAPLWSFNFLSWCELKMVYPFCRKVHEGGHEGCLPHDKKDSDETIHNLQLGLEVERPERTTTFSFYRYFTRKIFFF